MVTGGNTYTIRVSPRTASNDKGNLSITCSKQDYWQCSLIKIDNGNLGVINFNNMIPVTKDNYIVFDLNKKTNDKKELHRIKLLTNQLRWLTTNRKEILTKLKLLYNLYKNNKLPKNVRDRCCNFLLLEEKCKEYCFKHV